MSLLSIYFAMKKAIMCLKILRDILLPKSSLN